LAFLSFYFAFPFLHFVPFITFAFLVSSPKLMLLPIVLRKDRVPREGHFRKEQGLRLNGVDWGYHIWWAMDALKFQFGSSRAYNHFSSQATLRISPR